MDRSGDDPAFLNHFIKGSMSYLKEKLSMFYDDESNSKVLNFKIDFVYDDLILSKQT